MLVRASMLVPQGLLQFAYSRKTTLPVLSAACAAESYLALLSLTVMPTGAFRSACGAESEVQRACVSET